MTFARATRLGWDSLLRKPGFGFLLRDNGKDFDGLLGDVIEHPDFTYPEPIFGLIETSQALDPTLADLGRLVPQV